MKRRTFFAALASGLAALVPWRRRALVGREAAVGFMPERKPVFLNAADLDADLIKGDAIGRSYKIDRPVLVRAGESIKGCRFKMVGGGMLVVGPDAELVGNHFDGSELTTGCAVMYRWGELLPRGSVK